MIRFLADENFNRNIVRGVRRRNPTVDIVVTQDAGLTGADDPALLDWAADQGRLSLSHDMKTMPFHAGARLRNQQRMSGVVLFDRTVPILEAIEAILIIWECSQPEDWQGVVEYWD